MRKLHNLARQTRSRPCPTCRSIMSTSVSGQAKHMAACATKTEAEREWFREHGQFRKRGKAVRSHINEGVSS